MAHTVITNFENRAVAFIDILGFKGLVKSACTNHHTDVDTLNDIIALMDSVVPMLNGGLTHTFPKELIPQHIYISDCIILSAPLESDLPEYDYYDGLALLMIRCIQIQHILLKKGYILNGGIDIGTTWHTDSNIIGTGYQAAYLLQSDNKLPTVKLSDNALEHWKTVSLKKGQPARILQTYKGETFINMFEPHVLSEANKYNGIQSLYQNKYKPIIKENIQALANHQSAKDRWVWLDSFLDYAIEQRDFFFAE